MTIKAALLLALALLTSTYVIYWLVSARKSRGASGKGSVPLSFLRHRVRQEFQKPKVDNGVPDYSAKAMAKQARELKSF